MAVYLTTQGMRIVETNDRGNLTYQREYVRGDEVDTDHMDPARVDALLESGDLSHDNPKDQSSQDNDEARVQAASVNGPVGAEAKDAAGNPVTPTGEPGAGVDQLNTDQDDDSEADGGTPDEEEHDVDEYDGMDYAELQQEAKQRELNAGGSAADLRQRLRDADNS